MVKSILLVAAAAAAIGNVAAYQGPAYQVNNCPVANVLVAHTGKPVGQTNEVNGSKFDRLFNRSFSRVTKFKPTSPILRTRRSQTMQYCI